MGTLFALYVLGAMFFVIYREVSATEGASLLAARLTAQGHVLYADFAYPQGPVFPHVYGLLLGPFGHQLLAGRLLTALLNALGAGLAAGLAARLAARTTSNGGASAALLTLILLVSWPYATAQFAPTSPLALAALWLIAAVWAASARRRPALWGAVAMGAAALAAGTHLPTAPALVILALYLLAVARRRTYMLLVVLAGAIAASAVVWGPSLLADAEATVVNHRDWQPLPGANLAAAMEYPILILLLAGLAGMGLIAWWRAPDRRAWLRREALPLAVGGVILTVGRPQAIPLAGALVGYGLACLWLTLRSVRQRQVAIALITALLGLGFLFQLARCFDRGLLRPTGAGLNIALTRVSQAAAYANQHSAPGLPWLTLDANLVVAAQRDVLPGLEAGPLALTPWPTVQNQRFHRVNADLLLTLLRDPRVGLAAFTEADLARLGEKRASLETALRAGYYPLRDFDHYGPANDILRLYAPRGQTQPIGGPAVPLEARLGDSVTFLGYDLTTETGAPTPPDTPLIVRANETLHLTLYWRCLQPIDRDLIVFNHLVPADGGPGLRGQEDGAPGHGWAPTSSWVAGEVIVDHWAIWVWPDAPASENTLEVGLYDLPSGARLPVSRPDNTPWGDHLRLGRIHVTR